MLTIIKNMDKIYEKKLKLESTKQNLFKQIKEIDNILEEINQVIINNCIHEWITEREDGMYGERFTYCKKCNILRGF